MNGKLIGELAYQLGPPTINEAIDEVVDHRAHDLFVPSRDASGAERGAHELAPSPVFVTIEANKHRRAHHLADVTANYLARKRGVVAQDLRHEVERVHVQDRPR